MLQYIILGFSWLVVFFLLLWLKETISKKRLLRNYDVNDDLSRRKGGEVEGLGGREPTVENAEHVSPRPSELEGSRDLPTAKPTPVRKTSSSSGNYSDRLNFFKNYQQR